MDWKKQGTRIFWMLAILFMAVCSMGKTAYAENASLTITGTSNYDYAYQVLTILNEERKDAGVGELEMDKELLEAAMQRAAECAVSFSHVRPDGTACFSVSDKSYGENIAAGQKTPESVMASWMSSYGHKDNMLNSEYLSVGIGCFYQNGSLYWVQCFGYDSAISGTNPGKSKKTYTIEADISDMQLSIEKSSVSLIAGKSKTMKVKVSTKETWGSAASLDNSCLTWKSSNKNVAVVDNGKITGVSDGKATITAKLVAENGTTVAKVSTAVTCQKVSKVTSVKLSAGKRKLTLTWKKKTGIDGYQVQVATNKLYKNAQSYTVKKSATKKVFTKYKGKRLKAKKRYYIRIRAYVIETMQDGEQKKSYSNWTSINKVTK